MSYARPPRWAGKVAAMFVILTILFVVTAYVIYWFMVGGIV